MVWRAYGPMHPQKGKLGVRKSTSSILDMHQICHRRGTCEQNHLSKKGRKNEVNTVGVIGPWTHRTLEPVSWRPTTVKWRQFSQSNRHSTIGTRQTEYHEALPSYANDEMRCDCTFADDGNTSWYLVCRVLMVECRLDSENCRHLTVVGLHDTGPWTHQAVTRQHAPPDAVFVSPRHSSLTSLGLISSSYTSGWQDFRKESFIVVLPTPEKCNQERVCSLGCCLTPQQHASVSQGRSAQTILRAATLKLQIKLSTSPSHSILTPGRLVPALML